MEPGEWVGIAPENQMGCVVRIGGGTHCRDLRDLGAGGQVAGAEQMSD